MSQKNEQLRQYLEERGVHASSGRMGWQKVSCFNSAGHPRGDRNPSASVNLVTGYYHCFACGLQGDVYDLRDQELGLPAGTSFKQRDVKDEKVSEWI